MGKFCWITPVILIFICGCKSAGGVHTAQHAKHLPQNASAVADVQPQDSEQVGSDIHLASAETLAESGIATDSVSKLSLNESISLGLMQNPDLIALRESENVSTAALGVAQTYPFNPFVQVQATPSQETPSGGAGTTYHYVLLMQTIQLAHQQRFREAGGASLLNSTRWNIHQAELLNVAQTSRLYFNAIYLRGLFELANLSDQNNQQLLQTLQTQLDAGQATAADVAIVRVDAQSTSQQVRLAKSNYETALRDFKRQLGLFSHEPVMIEGDLRSFDWKIPTLRPTGITSNFDANQRNILIAGLVAARPDVMAAYSDIDVARAALCLATANKTPDLQIGPYYQRTADGTTFLGFRAQVDIPIINSGAPLERQRIAELKQRVVGCQQLQRRAEFEAQAAWERYELAYAALLEDEPAGVKDLPKELASLEQQFLEGEVDVVRVVQARTSIIQNQRVRLDILNEVAQSAANLISAATISLEETIAFSH